MDGTLSLEQYHEQITRLKSHNSHKQWICYEDRDELFLDTEFPNLHMVKRDQIRQINVSKIELDRYNDQNDEDFGETPYDVEDDLIVGPPLSSNTYISLTYYVWYNVAFSVPQLGITAVDMSGNNVEITDEFLKKIDFHNENTNSCNNTLSSQRQFTIDFPLLQIDRHPHLNILITSLHPCRTAQMMAYAGSNKQYLESWLNLMEQCLNISYPDRTIIEH